MKNVLILCIFVIPPFLCFNRLLAQSNLFVDTSYTATEMVNAFFGNSDVLVSNVTYTGDPAGKAFFDAGDTDLGINAGIILSTGQTREAANAASYEASTFFFLPGDTDLDQLIGSNFMTRDPSILEFDIVPSADTICFNYIFGSEEYPEYVGTEFNDVFAFFMSGGPEYANLTNIASIPGSSPAIPVTINNLNSNLNSNLYIPQFTVDSSLVFSTDYDSTATDIVYDAYTVLLPAKAAVTPSETYHIKIAIADVRDLSFDSGVFIGITSLGGDSLLTPIAEANFEVVGNQINIENTSSFAKSFEWDFGDGNTSTERHPEPYAYTDSGTYTVELTVHTWCCSSTFSDTITVTAPLVANFRVTPDEGNCPNDSFHFEDLSEGVIASWSWSFPGGLPSTSNAPNPTIIYQDPGVYNAALTVTDTFGLTQTLEVTAAVEINPLPTASFDKAVDGLQVTFQNQSENASTYLWNFGDGNQSTELSPTHTYTSEGNYTVSLTSINNCGEAIVESDIAVIIVSAEELPFSAFNLFPNPITDQLTIHSADNKAYNLEVYNVEGQLLINRQNLMGQTILNANQWRSGMYIIRFTNGRGALQRLVSKP